MTALVLSPHNDDCELFCCYSALREQAHVIVCLRSARMGAPGYPAPLIDHETREAETAAAMNVLGLEWEQWPFLDSAPDWDALEACLRGFDDEDAQFKASKVFAPAVESGGHDQHNRIGELALEVFGAERVTSYLTYTNGTCRSVGGVAVEYEPGWPALKRQALDCYRSQIEHPMTGHHFSRPLDEFYV